MISSTRTLKEEEEEEVGNGTVPAHEEKENECTIDRYHIRDLSLEKFNREYRRNQSSYSTHRG